MSETIQRAEAGYTYATRANLVVEDCATCGILHAIPAEFRQRRLDDGASWYCPNGHRMHFAKSNVDREREARERAERRAEQAEQAARYQREQAARERRTSAALRGHLTRMRNRIANGVCPVPGCKRSGFTNVMRHVAAKHPDWHAEHAHEVTE